MISNISPGSPCATGTHTYMHKKYTYMKTLKEKIVTLEHNFNVPEKFTPPPTLGTIYTYSHIPDFSN